MRNWVGPKRFVYAVSLMVLVATLASCGTSASTSSANIATQAPNGRGTEFDLPIRDGADSVPLVDQHGTGTSLGALKGRYVVIAPFLTICQDVCPMVSANFGRLSGIISKAGLDAKITLIELTVDPETDTPARLSAYQKIFGVKSNWNFYTGTLANVSKVLGALGIAFEKVKLTSAQAKEGNPDWLTGKIWDHDVSHQDLVVVIGPDGHERWLEQGMANAKGNPIPQTLKTYLSSDGRTNLASPDPAGSWTVSDVLAELSKLGGFKFS